MKWAYAAPCVLFGGSLHGYGVMKHGEAAQGLCAWLAPLSPGTLVHVHRSRALGGKGSCLPMGPRQTLTACDWVCLCHGDDVCPILLHMMPDGSKIVAHSLSYSPSLPFCSWLQAGLLNDLTQAYIGFCPSLSCLSLCCVLFACFFFQQIARSSCNRRSASTRCLAPKMNTTCLCGLVDIL